MPPALQHLIARLRALFRRDAVASEIQEELEFHLKMRIEEYERNGYSPKDARRMARGRVGNIAVHQDRGYDVRGGGVLETIIQDARHGARLLLKQPGFTCAAVLTLALGIAGTTTIFSVIDAAILRPLPYAHPEQLVSVAVEDKRVALGEDVHGGSSLTSPSLTDVRSLAASSAGATALAACRAFEERTLIDMGRGAERVGAREIAEGFLDVYGVRPALGRSIEAGDLANGAPPVVMLGHAFWQRAFGSDPHVVGKTIRFTTTTATIIGVAPAGFYTSTSIWRPINGRIPGWQGLPGLGLTTYARMRAGMTPAASAGEMSAVLRGRAGAYGATGDVRVQLTSLYQEATEGSGPTLIMLAGAVACILMIACVNVASLLMARGATRKQEFAVRASLGAGRGRLIRQLLTEGAVLAVVSGVVAVILARVSITALMSIVPFQVPENVTAAIDWRAMGFAAVASFVACMAFALWPAARLSKARIVNASIDSGRQGATLGRRGMRTMLTIEVAVAVLLLAGAGLLIRSFAKATQSDLGLTDEAAIVMEAEPIDQRPAGMQLFFSSLLEKLNSHPGVAAAGAADLGPLMEMGMIGPASLDVAGEDMIWYSTMLPRTPEALGLSLVEGRWPDAAEYTPASRVAILNEEAAKQLSPNRSAVGRKLIGASGAPRTVIAVMRNARHHPMQSAVAQIVIPSDRANEWPLPVVIRPTHGQPLSADVLRQIALSVDPQGFIGKIRPVSSLHGEQIATPRQRAALFSVFGATGFALTLVGIFGVTAYSVARRRTEIGVRMALGARPSQASAEIIKDVASTIAAGTAIGLIAAFAAARALSSFLFETTPNDPITLTGVAIFFAAGAVVAAWLPARRAARIDPVAALRAD